MAQRSVLVSMLSLPLLAPVSPVALTKSQHVVSAFDTSGAITLPSSRLKVDVDSATRKKERVELTVIFEPKTGCYLWLVGRNPNNADQAGVGLERIKEGKIVTFVEPQGLISFLFGSDLYVKVWQGRADSLDAAVAASLDELRRDPGTIGGTTYHRDYKFIPVFGTLRGYESKLPPNYKPISQEFTCKPFQSFCPPTNNTIAAVSKQGSNWRLVLRNRFDVEVILDQNLDLVSAQPLTQPKP